MARRLLAGFVLAAVLGAVGSAAAGQPPILRSAKVAQRHLLLQLSVVDVRPVELVVATKRAVNGEGALLPKNVRLREAIHLPATAATVVRWRSQGTLRPGTYFVQVTAVETDVSDCPPSLRNCNERWSNVRRVVVARSH